VPPPSALLCPQPARPPLPESSFRYLLLNLRCRWGPRDRQGSHNGRHRVRPKGCAALRTGSLHGCEHAAAVVQLRLPSTGGAVHGGRGAHLNVADGSLLTFTIAAGVSAGGVYHYIFDADRMQRRCTKGARRAPSALCVRAVTSVGACRAHSPIETLVHQHAEISMLAKP
jgi:hypothetical protein